MRVSSLDYELPAGSIAQHPCKERDGARMLVLDPRTSTLEDRHVRDLPRLVPPGALLVLNDTKVLAARLSGTKSVTGGKVELLLVEKVEHEASGEERGDTGQTWTALARGLGRSRAGELCTFGGGLAAELVGRREEGGLVLVWIFTENGRPVQAAIESQGQVPLPPYLRRRPNADDRERYQTVYARAPGAIAAPTAGLHLTPELLDRLRQHAHIGWLTLHVGIGTFQPVKTSDLDQHRMHAERYEITRELAAEVASARTRGAPIVAIGTTVARALETAADPDSEGHVRPEAGRTSLLIQPGYRFRVVDAMLTNFHLPRSTLVALVAAFAGRERVLDAYREAIVRGYRFYSYGDAMWIAGRAAFAGRPDGREG
jgi:S-adenosylmethionine:tRNA ribosyltransferase-isomerase